MWRPPTSLEEEEGEEEEEANEQNEKYTETDKEMDRLTSRQTDLPAM